jgi:hypothetical protein
MDAFSQFGVDPVKLIVQNLLAAIIFFIPAIIASARVINRYRSTTARLLWFSLIWMFPIAGAITALIQIPRSRPPKSPGN